GYTDSDFSNDVNDRRSTGGMAFYVNWNLVTWASQKQRCVALSSCEAEFMAATMAACQGLWLRRLLTNITGQNIPPVIMYVDNRECVEEGEITVTHVCGKEQKADLLMKPLARVKHEEMRDLIGVKGDYRGGYAKLTTTVDSRKIRDIQWKAMHGDIDKEEKVNDLIQADILPLVNYQTWVVNQIMENRGNGTWRMLVDFNDLNRACPKDNYPLPRVD
nr:hypothetical protein [Tanacetum cinerariifolium]